MKSTHLYGAQEHDEFQQKLIARRSELQQRLAQHNQQALNHQKAAAQLAGAVENVEYLLRTWVPPGSISQSVQHAPQVEGASA
jgi:hypothetical protein